MVCFYEINSYKLWGERVERRQLEYFLALVECGGVTSAAAHLHVSQPTISIALRSLEKEVGGLLFDRVPGGLALTAAGQALIEPARQIIRDLNVASESVRDVLGLAGGHLDICSVPAVAAGWLTGVVADFRRRHPGVSIRIHPETDDAVIAGDVRSGRYNLGLTVSDHTVNNLVAKHVGSQNLIALMPPGSPGAGTPIGVGELADMDLVTMHRGRSRSRQWLESQLQEAGKTPRVAVELGTTEGILPMVAAGAGYALWWTPMTGIPIGSCILRPILPTLERPINLLLRAGPVSPATTAFLDTVVSQ